MTTITPDRPQVETEPSEPRASHRRHSLDAVWQPCAVTLVLVVLTAVTGVRGADYPAHHLRALLWERAGAAIWNFHWYGGHPTATYGILSPPVVALFDPFVVVSVAAVVSTYCFSRLTADLLPGRTTMLANHLFAVAVTTNVVVGRVAFGLGLAIALLTVLAWSHRLDVAAVGIAALAGLSSPVAGTFLALAAVSYVIDRTRGGAPRGRLGTGIAIALAAMSPVVVASVVFQTEGRFPFRGGHFVLSMVVLIAAARLATASAVRVGAGLAAAASLLLFVIPNPLGGNMVRLAQIVVIPLVVIALGATSRTVILVGGTLSAVAVGWSVSPGAVAAVDWVGDPSSRREYHVPLIEEVARRNSDGRPVGRVEIPFTLNHWESYYVAAEVPYVRGWERQTDVVRNGALYDPTLDEDGYRRWLRTNAVRWVALPDAPIDDDGGGRWEQSLLAPHAPAPPWLRLVWSDAHWRLFEIVDYVPIVDPPAELVAQETDHVVVRVDRAATVTIRYAYTDRISISAGACVSRNEDGWIEATLPRAGEYELIVSWVGGRDECAIPGGGRRR